jgi:hypothetical protein
MVARRRAILDGMSSQGGDLTVLRQYYTLFNERRLTEAAQLVAPECEFEHVQSGAQARGPEGYLALSEAWLRAAPDLTSTIDEIQEIDRGVYRVVVVIRGTLTAPFEPSSNLRVAGDGRSFTLRATQRVRVSGGQIAASRTLLGSSPVRRTPCRHGPVRCAVSATPCSRGRACQSSGCSARSASIRGSTGLRSPALSDSVHLRQLDRSFGAGRPWIAVQPAVGESSDLSVGSRVRKTT